MHEPGLDAMELQLQIARYLEALSRADEIVRSEHDELSFRVARQAQFAAELIVPVLKDRLGTEELEQQSGIAVARGDLDPTAAIEGLGKARSAR